MPHHHFSKVCFYIVAHADDWQLFMCPNVYNDLIATNSKVVFIITTAGDAGLDKKFWLAREEGSKSSVRFCLASAGNFLESEEIKKFNGHNIYYWCAGNTVSYFLRLPDGNLNGSGFSSNNFQSISKLKTGEIKSMTAVDNSTTYDGWTDFFTTLETIILNESNNIAERYINYINPDETINFNEHADHIATGNAIQCMNIISSMCQQLFKGYGLNNAKNSINNIDLFWKAGMFAAYDKAVFDNSGYSTLKEDISTYLKWCLSSAQFITVEPVNKKDSL